MIVENVLFDFVVKLNFVWFIENDVKEIVK